MDTSNLRNRRGQRLDATFHDAPNTRYLALFGHGVTGDKDRPLVKEVAEELSQRGLPTLRFSFAGNGKSEGRFEDCTITTEAEDLVDLLDQLVAPERQIIYIGHSMGAAVGTLVAAQDPKRIKILISLAGMVHTKAFFEREFGDQKPGEGFMWDEPTCPLSQTAWDDALQIGDTLSAAERVSQPWLLIHGTDDDVVPIEDSRQALRANLQSAPRKLIEIPDVSHMFSEQTYSQIAQSIADWITAH